MRSSSALLVVVAIRRIYQTAGQGATGVMLFLVSVVLSPNPPARLPTTHRRSAHPILDQISFFPWHRESKGRFPQIALLTSAYGHNTRYRWQMHDTCRVETCELTPCQL